MCEMGSHLQLCCSSVEQQKNSWNSCPTKIVVEYSTQEYTCRHKKKKEIKHQLPGSAHFSCAILCDDSSEHGRHRVQGPDDCDDWDAVNDRGNHHNNKCIVEIHSTSARFPLYSTSARFPIHMSASRDRSHRKIIPRWPDQPIHESAVCTTECYTSAKSLHGLVQTVISFRAFQLQECMWSHITSEGFSPPYILDLKLQPVEFYWTNLATNRHTDVLVHCMDAWVWRARFLAIESWWLEALKRLIFLVCSIHFLCCILEENGQWKWKLKIDIKSLSSSYSYV